MSHPSKHVGPENCFQAPVHDMCNECRMALGHPFDLLGLDRELDKDGIGWHPHRARIEGMAPPQIVFVRDDDWSLGSTRELEPLAYDYWRDLWTMYAEAPGWELRPISEYRP